MMMGNKLVFVLLGPPGSGKGTQAERISQAFKLEHIDTGQALREEIRLQSEIGQIAKSYVDKGQLVPSDVVQGVIESAMLRIKPEQQGYLLDGFPRNYEQAKGLDLILAHLGQSLNSVFYMDIPMPLLFDRLAYRQSCSQCSTKYNTKLNPPIKPDTCDRCGTSSLVSRKDDAPEVIQSRLDSYQAETSPLVQLYTERGLLERIDASQSIDLVVKTLSDSIHSHEKIFAGATQA